MDLDRHGAAAVPPRTPAEARRGRDDLRPLLYGAMYLWAFWDPTGNLDKLPVAIVNSDTGATIRSDDGDETLNAGEEVTTTLVDSGDLQWAQVDAAEAEQGVKDGTYYFALTIPEGFSEGIASAAGDDPQAAQLMVTYNDANSFLATTLGRSAMTQVQGAVREEIGAQAVDKVLVGLGSARDGFAQASDGSLTLTTASGQLTDGATQVADGATAAADGAGSLAAGIDQLAAARGARSTARASSRAGPHAVRRRVLRERGSLAAGRGRLVRRRRRVDPRRSRRHDAVGHGPARGRLAPARRGLHSPDRPGGRGGQGRRGCPAGVRRRRAGPGTGHLARRERPDAPRAAPAERGGARRLGRPPGPGARGREPAGPGPAALGRRARAERGRLQTLANGSKQLATDTTSGLPALSAGIKAASAGAAQIDAQLRPGAGDTTVRDGVDGVAAGAATLSSGLTTLEGGASDLAQGNASLASGAGTLAAGTSSLYSGAQQLATGAQSAATGAGTLADGTRTLADGATQVADGGTRLTEGAQTLTDKLAEGSEAIPDDSTALREQRAEVIAAP
ncbi:YhgE/Pip family protein [Oerskovia sp. M15]